MDIYVLRSRSWLAFAAVCWPALSHAALGFDEAARLAREQAPSLLAQRNALAGAQAAQPAAATLPDPRLTLGVDNLPVSGPDRFSLTRDFMTMKRVGLMQEVPNRAKRDARAGGAQARIDREQALLQAAGLTVQREAKLAWLAVYYAQRRLAELDALDAENRVLLDTIGPRIAAGKAMPADRAMAQQEKLALADRRDEANRDVAKARASLRRWVGDRADEPLAGEPPQVTVEAGSVRAGLHSHAELAPYEAMRAVALAEASEATADSRGDWSWELAYSRRGAQYGDMVSFQVSLDLPWQTERRQQPQALAKLKEVERIDAERQDMARKHQEEVEGQLAELQALDAQRARLQASGRPLAAERVALAMASYQAGRGDLPAVLAARREAVDLGLRLLDLDLQRASLRVRLTTLIAEQ
ncbi:heavy metal RND transporter [Caenimonas koreensis DSM 17982]|uniref:Heavy metal RND transporter n=1 Tax=Caenimonas koreensis DSM 17982 TaxID=1121255 RepID=A0A844B5P1_9BURK|nr:TolC family protein [Caenimonas koreensis]MRD48512.1 heavy metal RND transporter [Caenimonas koreensis DSM 17982]